MTGFKFETKSTDEMVDDLTPDDHQNIARSNYADMLTDDERNLAYNLAIRSSVKFLVDSNPQKFFNCVDIGTGSGLLTLMLVEAFKECNHNGYRIYAFEGFKPMANCAEKVFQANVPFWSQYISLIPEYSHQFDPGVRFDLLVAELLDTELIGEGCIGAYRHAVEKLCNPECLFVPHQARIFIEPVASLSLFHRHAIDDIEIDLDENRSIKIEIPQEVKNCKGVNAIDDMQVSQLREHVDFIRISEPTIVFEFIFNDIKTLKERDLNVIEFPIKKSVTEPPVLVMWWDIIMCDKKIFDPFIRGQHILPNDLDWERLTCAPSWARDEIILKRDEVIRSRYGRDVWREHWIQGIYYLMDVKGTRELVNKLNVGSTLGVYAYHDLWHLNFDLEASHPGKEPLVALCPTSYCHCTEHSGLSRTQLAFLSDKEQMKKLIKPLLIDQINHPFTGSIEFGKRGKKIKIDENWRITFYDKNKHLIENRCLMDLSLQNEAPWSALAKNSRNGFDISPVESFVIKCALVRFANLHRIVAKIKRWEIFDLTHLDTLIRTSSEIVDNKFEPHYLWEYPCTRLGEDQIYYSFQYDNVTGRTKESFFRLLDLRNKHDTSSSFDDIGLAFWVELKMKHTGDILSTGPINPNSPIGDRLEWNRLSRQVVLFLSDLDLTKITNYDGFSKVNLDIVDLKESVLFVN